MDEDPPPILSRTKFSSFEENDTQISDRKFVERMKDEGLMTSDPILERFTTEIYDTLFRDEQELVENIKDNFQAIKEPNPGIEVVSPSKFTAFLSQHFSGFEGFVQDGILAIYESFQVYGNFPFPAPSTETRPGLTFEQFLRAVAFMWDTQPYYPQATSLTYESFMGGVGGMGGNLGPHHGHYITGRQRTQQDRRRLDFRALAVKMRNPQPPSNEEMKNAKISITYFKKFVPDEGFGDAHLQLEFADEEDERGVDVVDVLNVTFPESDDPMDAPPMLCSLRSIAAQLPKQLYLLYEMRIPYSKLFGLVKLLLLVQLKYFGNVESYFADQIEGLNASAKCIINGFTEGEDVRWEAFDEVVKRNLPAFFLGGLHHIARPFLSPQEDGDDDEDDEDDDSLLTFPSNHTSILTYPLLAQLHTFSPTRSDDISWNNLHLLQHHSKSSLLTISTLQASLQTYTKPTLLLLSGYEINPLTSAKTHVVVGALIRSPWTSKETEHPDDETRLWKTTLFQLAPVQRVYATRKEKHNPFPVLQANGIGIGREVDDAAMEADMGTTGLVIDKRLDRAVFEHGKGDGRNGAFEGFCPFGVGKEGIVRIEVGVLEVWGC
ncbi:hypothetical protein G7Y89_g11068 [Cudoniella acicularis]|uniref:TLDc domain-containing protein n=1 Tax=Cudoniella acicularis TaxID=354080 RepID=A0A8H4VY65_9HELO|nr:hypothetical protein G7Y89_g11068 [Cudoniella acicularis]